jgi:hypothetical protein
MEFPERGCIGPNLYSLGKSPKGLKKGKDKS